MAKIRIKDYQKKKKNLAHQKILLCFFFTVTTACVKLAIFSLNNTWKNSEDKLSPAMGHQGGVRNFIYNFYFLKIYLRYRSEYIQEICTKANPT